MKTDLRPRNVEQSAAAAKTLQAARPAPPSDAPETAPIHQTITPEQAALAAQVPRPPRRPAPTPQEFNTAMAHFYRGEITRANTWRNRLDTTTNWAVLTTGPTPPFAC